MRTIKLLCVLAALVTLPTTAHAQAKGPLAALDFLMGKWEAIPDATGNTGTCAFSLSLQDQVVVRTNHSDTAAAGGRPASKHDDLMVIYVDGKAVKADYYDSETHVIHYVVQSPAANNVVFQADATATEPGYRLSYQLQADGSVKGQFELAQPGKPGAWATYLSWGMRKMK